MRREEGSSGFYVVGQDVGLSALSRWKCQAVLRQGCRAEKQLLRPRAGWPVLALACARECPASAIASTAARPTQNAGSQNS